MIRTAVSDDAPEIARVVNEAFEVEREFRPGDRTNADEVRQILERDAFLVLEQDGRIVAAVHVRVTPPTGYFGMLGVEHAAQGGGLGRTLTFAAEDYCRQRGCTEMTLSTGAERSQLVAWYERLGYRVTRTAPSDNPAFNRAIPVVEMSKPL
jgi:ribosomal protein S18 acetylase RimI-like enzyme